MTDTIAKEGTVIKMERYSFIPFDQVDLADGFWRDRYEINRTVSIENVKNALRRPGAWMRSDSIFSKQASARMFFMIRTLQNGWKQ